jgi:hypothetical protein
LVHPLTETRLPALTQTSARATPDGWIVANSSGTAVNASIPMANAGHVRLVRLIAISLPLPGFPANRRAGLSEVYPRSFDKAYVWSGSPPGLRALVT